jgi:hypothetical protein
MLLDIILAVIILINILLGLKRGFIVTIGRLAILVLIVAIVLLLAGPLADTLAKSPILAPLSDKIGNAILKPLADSAANIGMAIESFGIPKMLANLLQSQLPSADNTVTKVFPEFSNVLFKFVINAIIYLLLFILVIVVISLLTRALTRAADKLPLIGAGNRFGGLLVGLVIGVVQVSIILLMLGFLSPVWPAAASAISDSWVASRFYEIDILSLIF